MAAPTAARRLQAAPARPARRPSPQPRRAPLRVVQPDARIRIVGTMGTLVVIALFGILFTIAGLHAVLVQTQARLDAQRAANATLVEEVVDLEAELAWLESPAGIEEWAEASGLVRAPGYAELAIVVPGQLAAPPAGDPFASTGGAVSG